MPYADRPGSSPESPPPALIPQLDVDARGGSDAENLDTAEETVSRLPPQI
jgi:hypothetical protein